eukprot:TRINITY_DN27588_c0_g1_i1.p1 TRINITY_DN27588_c0_g1~~TRINITY_DN27588_c0_g1_i1.p1  ORF type:complete len:352 (+),score=63.87 TRINITY_DN27588_c0_g1_i1:51-1106(+)
MTHPQRLTLLSVLALCHAGAPPRFSWDTLPVFYHAANTSGPFSDEAIQLLAKYPMVTIEKFQGTCWQDKGTPDCHQEEIIINELKRIKAINSNVSTIAYFNSVLDFPFYSMHQVMLEHEQYMLHYANGSVFKQHGDHFYGDAFDWTEPGMVDLFLHTCINATQTGYADGCFADRSVSTIAHGAVASHGDWDAAHLAGLQKLSAAIAPGPLVANHAYNETGLSAAMIETCTPNAAGFAEYQATVASSKIAQCHCGGDTGLKCTEEDAKFNSTVAMFLIGAQPNAYFGCGAWLYSGNNITQDVLWMDMYDRPLGAPESDAVKSGDVYTRKFASGTWAEWNIATGHGQVHWAAS